MDVQALNATLASAGVMCRDMTALLEADPEQNLELLGNHLAKTPQNAFLVSRTAKLEGLFRRQIKLQPHADRADWILLYRDRGMGVARQDAPEQTRSSALALVFGYDDGGCPLCLAPLPRELGRGPHGLHAECMRLHCPACYRVHLSQQRAPRQAVGHSHSE